MSTPKELRDKAYDLKAEAEALLVESRKLEADQRRKEQEAHRAEENLKIEKSKSKLSKEYGIPRNSKFDRAYELAWEYGRSYGFQEIENYFHELSDLLKP